MKTMPTPRASPVRTPPEDSAPAATKPGKKFTHRPRPQPPMEPVVVSPTLAIIRRPIMASSVRLAACQMMGVNVLDLAGRTRHPRVVWARRIITRLCRIYTTLSFPDIAELVGRPNHSTVITSDQRMDELLMLPVGDALRLVFLEHGPDKPGTDVQHLMDAIAKNITRDPIVSILPEEPARKSA